MLQTNYKESRICTCTYLRTKFRDAIYRQKNSERNHANDVSVPLRGWNKPFTTNIFLLENFSQPSRFNSVVLFIVTKQQQQNMNIINYLSICIHMNMKICYLIQGEFPISGANCFLDVSSKWKSALTYIYFKYFCTILSSSVLSSTKKD